MIHLPTKEEGSNKRELRKRGGMGKLKEKNN